MTTADDVLVIAKRIITEFGWERMAHPVYGPAPRCIRSAITCAAIDLQLPARSTQVQDALFRVSEAIYGPGTVGGINDWEHKKKVNRDVVIALLQKAIEAGPSERELNGTVWPTGRAT